MNKFWIFFFLIFLHQSDKLNAQSKSDSVNIINTVNLYNKGWYEGDTVKMAKALHRDLIKRIIHKKQNSTIQEIKNCSYDMLIKYTKAGYGKNTPKEQQNDKITILNIFENIACVKNDAYDLVDFLQLAKINEEWKIINVLWALKAVK